MAKQGDNGAAERVVTRRLVLKRVSAIQVPDAATPEQIAEAMKVLGVKQRQATKTVMWLECGEFEGSKRSAIEAFAGKPGTPDARVGEFKAPSVTSMKGGERYTQPPLPKVEREAIV